MPIYSYRCDNCGETFDKLVKPGDSCDVTCAHCQSEVRRVFSPVGIIFKGSGFYTTDYKSGSSKANNVAGAKKPVKKKEESKTDTADSGKKEKTAEKAKS